ncbi:hypothetical protein AB4156_43040, partial [Cupriavidus sp. 2MCAB6]
LILNGDKPPESLTPPVLPEVVVTIETAPKAANAEPEMVTGTVAPSAQPQGGLAPLEVPPTPATTPGVDLDEPVVLDIPAIDLPPSDPALVPAARPAPLRSAEPVIAPPDLPKVVVELPAGPALAAEITERAPEALALPRLAERERSEI